MTHAPIRCNSLGCTYCRPHKPVPLGFALLLLVALCLGCGAHPTMSGGMPGAVVPIDDAPDKGALCTGAANRCILLGCGCGISARCTETPEQLWCVARAKTCGDIEACRE